MLKLLTDLSDDRLEVTLEVGDGAGGMSLCVLAELLDLGEGLLGLTGGVAAKRCGHLLRPGLGVVQRAFDDARIVTHLAVKFLRLGVDRVQERNDGLMAAFEDRVDLGV